MRADLLPLIPALFANLVAALKDFHITAAGTAHGITANRTVGILRYQGKLCVDASHCTVCEVVVAVRLLHHSINNPHALNFISTHAVLTVDAGNRPNEKTS